MFVLSQPSHAVTICHRIFNLKKKNKLVQKVKYELGDLLFFIYRSHINLYKHFFLFTFIPHSCIELNELNVKRNRRSRQNSFKELICISRVVF